MDRLFTPIVPMAVALLATGAVFAQSTGGDERVSVTQQMSRAERDAGAVLKRREDRYGALTTGSARDKTAGPASKSAAASTTPRLDFWFYDADVILFNDDDLDGYFHGIDLLFDADTVWDYAEVYAVAYLSLDGGPWNEYAATDVFALTGAVADDEYVIVTELVSGYPTGSYDLLIELFDADTGEFLSSFGPEDSSALTFLPLEDAGRDMPGGTTTVVVTERGGGSLGWPALFLLLAATVRAARRRGSAP